MNERKTYKQGKIDGRNELVEIINSAPPIIAETPPLTFSEGDMARMKLDIKDNFPDLTEDDRTQIMDYITSRALNYVTTI